MKNKVRYCISLSCLFMLAAVCAAPATAATFAVTNVTDRGEGSLRQAILDANAHPDNFSDPATITFNIGSGAKTIQPLTPLPIITGHVAIDGTTQPGYSGTPLIEISGASAVDETNGEVDGLSFNVPNDSAFSSNVKGLILNRFGGDGIEIGGTSAQVNITKCYIGTNATGAVAAPNGRNGVHINGASNNRVGGSEAGQGNLISGNGASGISISAGSTNIIQQNRIGTNAAGTAAIGNTINGISVENSSSGNVIGGVASGAGNRIAYNSNDGILVSGALSLGNSIRGNQLLLNGGLGINLHPEGEAPNTRTNNDTGDLDTGPNRLQNFPTLSSVSFSSDSTVVSGTLQSSASTRFTIDFYRSAQLNSLNTGEGEAYLASTTVTTNASGTVGFSNVSLGGNYGSQYITATATDASNNTSEFSLPVQVPSTIQFSSATYTVDEGDGDGNATITLIRQGTSSQASVQYATSNGTASQSSDYTPSGGSVNFADGQSSASFTVSITNDTTDEEDETIAITLSSPSGAALISPSTATLTIVDNDAPPQLSISDVLTVEGNSGSTQSAAFTLSLSSASSKTVSVNYTSAGGTASSDKDFIATSGTLTFAPGETTKAAIIPIIGDILDEPNEVFYVLLSSPTNATLSRARGTATIQDNEPAPSISVDNVTVVEGNSGSRYATFTLRLSAPSSQIVRVTAQSVNGTTNPATAGSDYTALAPTVISFNTGTTAAIVRVLVHSDVLDERNESFFLNLSNPVNATIGINRGLGSITDDDATPGLVINDASITEGNSGTKMLNFTVTRTGRSANNITVNYATANGSAQATSDYVARSGMLTFAPGGAATQSISITINGDTTVEANETIIVLLSGAVNAAVSRARGVGTIANDDSSG